MNMNRHQLLVAGGLLLITLISVPAQVENVGELNTWTTKPFSRSHPAATENPHIKLVSAAKQNGFDRVVFEFRGQIPNYRIEYLPGRIYEATAGRERIRQPGNFFLQINFFVIPGDEEQMKFIDAGNFRPKGALKMPALRSVRDKEFFEGYFDFLMGVSSRRPYRVIELSTPSRLVIDFKH